MLSDRVFFATATTGTGTITAGAAEVGFDPLSDIADGLEVPYCIVDGVAWETGLGVVGATGTTLTRPTAPIKSSNSNNPLNLDGVAKCFIMPTAEYMNRLSRMRMVASATIPGASDANTIESAVHLIAGIPHEVIINSTGRAIIPDPLAMNRQSIMTEPGSGTTTSQRGAALTFTGAVSHPSTADTSYFLSCIRARVATTATAGTLAGWRNNSIAEIYRSRGFRHRSIVGTTALVAGQRMFFGLSSSIAAQANIDPLTDTTINKIGIGYNTNSGNLKIIHNLTGQAPTVIDLGVDFPVNATDAHALFLSALPSGNINWDVRKLSTVNGDYVAKQTGVISTNMPTATTGLVRYSMLTNNATAALASFDFLQLNSHRM